MRCVVILTAPWVLGLVSNSTKGGSIHFPLGIATIITTIVVVVGFITGRKTGSATAYPDPATSLKGTCLKAFKMAAIGLGGR